MNAFVNGVGTTTTVILNAAGSGVTITATDGTHTGTSNPFTVNPTISALAAADGSISPSGTFPVNYDGSQTFTITPNSGYYIADVLVNGVSVGVVSSYTFTNIQVSGDIYAEFTQTPPSTPAPTATSTPTSTSSPSTTSTPTATQTPSPTPKPTPKITPTPTTKSAQNPTATPSSTQNPLTAATQTQFSKFT